MYEWLLSIGAGQIMVDVVGGALMGKIRAGPQGPLVDHNINTGLITQIYNIMSRPYPRAGTCVYRATLLNLDLLDIEIPISASTTLSIDFAVRWLTVQGFINLPSSCCILKIEMDSQVPYLAIQRPSEPGSQDEILIPAGQLIVDRKYRRQDGITIIEGKLSPWSQKQCLQYISDHKF